MGDWYITVLLFLSLTFFTSAGRSRRGTSTWSRADPVEPTAFEPGFANNSVTNLTVQAGDTAFLSCRVKNLGDNTISWIRLKDFSILTSGPTRYTSDDRVQVIAADSEEEWTLIIKFVNAADAGRYECQISTGSGTVSTFVSLHVMIPEAFLIGNGDLHVNRGSTINLNCIIQKTLRPPEFVFWYHGENAINHDKTRTRVSVSTESGSRTHSRLEITNAQPEDTGNYTCSAASATPASIYVFVQDDKTSAYQVNAAWNAAARGSKTPLLFLLPVAHLHLFRISLSTSAS